MPREGLGIAGMPRHSRGTPDSRPALPRPPIGNRPESGSYPWPVPWRDQQASDRRWGGGRGVCYPSSGLRPPLLPVGEGRMQGNCAREDWFVAQAGGCQPASAQSSPLTAELQIMK